MPAERVQVLVGSCSAGGMVDAMVLVGLPCGSPAKREDARAVSDLYPAAQRGARETPSIVSRVSAWALGASTLGASTLRASTGGWRVAANPVMTSGRSIDLVEDLLPRCVLADGSLLQGM